MKSQLLLAVIIIIIVSGIVIAWEQNPVYNPLEVIWNAIDKLQSQIDDISAGTSCERPGNMILEIAGVISSKNFEFIGPITVETKVIEYQDGDDTILRKRPGRTNTMSFEVWADITSIEAASLFNWRNKLFNGLIERKSASIIIRDSRGFEKLRYNIFEAWPSKLKTPVVDPCTGKLIEKYTITLEKLERG